MSTSSNTIFSSGKIDEYVEVGWWMNLQNWTMDEFVEDEQCKKVGQWTNQGKVKQNSVVFRSSCKQTFPPLPKMNGIKHELTMWMEYLGSKCVLWWPRHWHRA
jgi:hypothetical protein